MFCFMHTRILYSFPFWALNTLILAFVYVRQLTVMLPISLVVFVVLSAAVPQTYCFRERRQGECSCMEKEMAGETRDHAWLGIYILIV